MKRILIAKTSLDGHWRGIAVVTRLLRDGGFEVIYGGELRATEICRTAAEEDVDLIGLNIGGRIEVVDRILDEMVTQGIDDIPVFAGGTLTPRGVEALEARGVRCFTPGSTAEDIVAAAHELIAGAGTR
jgi:methylmalonyl-CoA mutase C-terminal domain/subunit